MKNRRSLPVAALRAFEAAARHGRLSAAAEELGVTHGAVSRHVGHLEAFIGAPLFEGPRNRPKLTAEGRIFGQALTSAFDQIEDALRIIGRGDGRILDVACLSTFAMRWLIPRLHEFTARHPRYDVRLATDDRGPHDSVDARILVLPREAALPENAALLFSEKLALVVAPLLAPDDQVDPLALPRLKTRTRPEVWLEWARLMQGGASGGFPQDGALDAANDLAPCLAFLCAAAGTGLCLLVLAHPHNGDAVERGVGLPFPPRLRRIRFVLPLEAGIGQTPQSLVKAAPDLEHFPIIQADIRRLRNRLGIRPV